jgi:hypothetical protein
MSDIKVNNITNRGGNGGPVIAGISTVATSAFIIMPSGDTAIRGAGSGRGVFAGRDPSADSIDMIEIASTGDATDFGDLTRNKQAVSGTASASRGVVFGGYASPSYFTDIDYITVSSGGGAAEFGDLPTARGWSAACGDGIKGLVAGSWPGPAAVDFVNIATTGDASNFGELVVRPYGQGGSAVGHEITGGCGSPTRGIFGGGAHGTPSTTAINLIQFISIQSGGNSIKFGELNKLSYGVTASSNSTRGLFYGGRTPSAHDVIDFITIATEGNATDFGNLSDSKFDCSACASSTRGVVAGGRTPSYLNIIEFVTISSTGNVSDFGDLTSTRSQMGGFSDVHGGLG